MSDPATPAAAPTPAATVVPLRDGDDGLEVLMLRRNSRGPFGGMWVFPGGKVDPADLVGEEGATADAAEVAAARRAAVREAAEEAGLGIAEDSLVTLSFWIPPVEVERRFATWFFLASVPDGEVTVDRAEIFEHRWTRPATAMAARQEGGFELAPPTYMTLAWLAGHRDVSSAMQAAGDRPPERFATRAAMVDGKLRATVWEGDAGYADGDLERVGPRRRLLLDPAGWRIELSGL